MSRRHVNVLLPEVRVTACALDTCDGLGRAGAAELGNRSVSGRVSATGDGLEEMDLQDLDLHATCDGEYPPERTHSR